MVGCLERDPCPPAGDDGGKLRGEVVPTVKAAPVEDPWPTLPEMLAILAEESIVTVECEGEVSMD